MKNKPRKLRRFRQKAVNPQSDTSGEKASVAPVPIPAIVTEVLQKIRMLTDMTEKEYEMKSQLLIQPLLQEIILLRKALSEWAAMQSEKINTIEAKTRLHQLEVIAKLAGRKRIPQEEMRKLGAYINGWGNCAYLHGIHFKQTFLHSSYHIAPE